MTEERKRSTKETSAQHELLSGASEDGSADITDVSSQVAWLEEQERRELRRDRLSRLEQINPKVSSPSPITTHPRDMAAIELVSRDMALEMLKVTSSELTKLVRRAVIRKAHPDLRTQFLYRDVAALAQTPPKTSARTEMEKRLRLRNTLEYLSDFVPQAYYDLQGEPVPVDDMDYIDRVANQQYQEGMVSLSAKFRSLLRPVAYSEARDFTHEHDVQFLYLADETVPAMTAALQMRRWYQETHPHTRFHVRRVALPPLNMLNRPEHANVLKFLVQSATILYGLDFEVMPDEYYEMITEQQMTPGLADQNLYRTLTGARISDKTELLTLLSAAAPVNVLPLQYTVAAWYQAYHALMESEAGSPVFGIKRQSYLDDLLKQVDAYDDSGQVDSIDLANLRRSIRQILGCPEDWALKFSHNQPPAYIGQPPSYEPPKGGQAEPDPGRTRLHPALRNTHLSRNTVYLMGENSMEDMEPAQLRIAEKVVMALDAFHKKVVTLITASSTTKADRLLTARLFYLLHQEGIEPRSLYLYPIRDAAKLYDRIWPSAKVNRLVEKIFPLLAEAQGRAGEVSDMKRPETEAITELPDVNNEPALAGNPQLADVSIEQRRTFVRVFAVEKLGFSEADISALTEDELLESMGEATQAALNEFIVKSMTSGAHDQQTSKILDLDDLS